MSAFRQRHIKYIYVQAETHLTYSNSTPMYQFLTFLSKQKGTLRHEIGTLIVMPEMNDNPTVKKTKLETPNVQVHNNCYYSGYLSYMPPAKGHGIDLEDSPFFIPTTHFDKGKER